MSFSQPLHESRGQVTSALSVAAFRERAAAILRSTAGVIEDVNTSRSGDMNGEALALAAMTIVSATANIAFGLQAAQTQWGELMSETWNTNARQAVRDFLSMSSKAKTKITDALHAYVLLVEAMEKLFVQLEDTLRKHAMNALGSGRLVAETDFRDLLA